MERKSSKALLVNGIAILFALVAIISLFFSLMKFEFMGISEKISMFDVLTNKDGAGQNTNIDIYLIIGLILAVAMIVCAILNYLGIIKFKFMPFILMAIGAAMILMAILVYVDCGDSLKQEGVKIGFGWILLLISSILSTAGAVGTLFFKE